MIMIHPIELLHKQLEVYEQELSRANRNMGVYLCPRAKKDLEGMIDKYKKAIKKLGFGVNVIFQNNE